MGRLARKEGTIKVIILVLFLSLLVACSPIISTTSLIHSVVKGDAFGAVTGVMSNIARTVKPQPEPPKKKTRAEIMEDLRKVLER
jgi:hypothetical protein